MKWLVITIVSFSIFELAVAQHDGYRCSYNNGHVVEKGYAPRAMTADEQQQLAEFEKLWDQWKPQFRLYMKGDAAEMPAIPAVPCFCREPCLGNAIGNVFV